MLVYQSQFRRGLELTTALSISFASSRRRGVYALCHEFDSRKYAAAAAEVPVVDRHKSNQERTPRVMSPRSAIILTSFYLAATMSALADETPRESASSRLIEELSREFHLDGPRTAEERFYQSTTVMTKVFTDGKKQPGGAIRLFLQATPGEKRKDGKTAFTYSCRRLEIERDDGNKVTVPELEKFTYEIEPGIDAKR